MAIPFRFAGPELNRIGYRLAGVRTPTVSGSDSNGPSGIWSPCAAIHLPLTGSEACSRKAALPPGRPLFACYQPVYFRAATAAFRRGTRPGVLSGLPLVLTCATAVLTRHSPPERGALPRWFTSCGRHELRCRGGLRLHSPGPLWPGCGGVPCRTPRRIGKPERPDVPQPSGELAPCAGRDSNPHLPLLGGVLCLLSYRQPPRVARWAPHLGPRCAGLPVRLRAPAERVCWVITGRPKRADDSMACRRVLRLVAPGLMSPELVPCVSRAGIEPTCLPAWAEVNPVT
jgi:hypothetical protein